MIPQKNHLCLWCTRSVRRSMWENIWPGWAGTGIPSRHPAPSIPWRHTASDPVWERACTCGRSSRRSHWRRENCVGGAKFWVGGCLPDSWGGRCWARFLQSLLSREWLYSPRWKTAQSRRTAIWLFLIIMFLLVICEIHSEIEIIFSTKLEYKNWKLDFAEIQPITVKFFHEFSSLIFCARN